eukprot:g73874.t1
MSRYPRLILALAKSINNQVMETYPEVYAKAALPTLSTGPPNKLYRWLFNMNDYTQAVAVRLRNEGKGLHYFFRNHPYRTVFVGLSLGVLVHNLGTHGLGKPVVTVGYLSLLVALLTPF